MRRAAFGHWTCSTTLVEQYAQLLADLAATGFSWVQLDEPALTREPSGAELAATARAYARLG
ncbi:MULTISPECIES: hypothetical protein [unclassified Frankia]|uniref:hypothetical protein n=1 Tax=unclassified Frankia TaxID=2632575 RepID=UPI0019343A1E|nr:MULTISPECIES: hypothetical protein [unclassified Frankia]